MRRLPQLSLMIFCLQVLASCAALDDAGPVHSVYRPASGKATWSRVIYVTTRVPDPDTPNSFTARWDDAPHCGMAETVVPAAPLPDQDVPWGYIEKLHPESCSTAGQPFAAIAAHIAQQAKIKHCSSVFLFVHGFHTGFDSAVLRAAQIGRDAQTGCVVAAFSWPGGEKLTGYVADVERSSYARPALTAFIRALAQTGLKISVLGHSMGARLSLSALAALRYAQKQPPRPVVDQLVLAAPDIGDDPADSDAMHLLSAAALFVRRITIYGSHNDAVLKVSENAHAGVARLGQLSAASQADRAHGAVDVIDASDAPADATGHSYFAMSYEVMADVAGVLRGVSVEERLASGTLLSADPAVIRTDRRPRFITRIMADLAPAVP